MRWILKPLVWLGLAMVIWMIVAWSWAFGPVGLVVAGFVIYRGLSRGRAAHA